MRPVFVHIRNTDNLGDLNSCPAEGWADYDHCHRIDLCEVNKFPAGTPLIVGGGGLFMPPTERLFRDWSKKYPVIVWGAGLNYPNLEDSHAAMEGILGEGLRACKLVGVRNEDLAKEFGFDFVPCGSCMNPAFLHHYPSGIRPLGLYEHKDRRFAFRGYRAMTNRHNSFNEAIEFLATSQCVVTNSFHGAYWSLLLGCRVSLWNPQHFGNRFESALPAVLGVCNTVSDVTRGGFGWRDSGYLQSCRTKNEAFKLKVDALLATL